MLTNCTHMRRHDVHGREPMFYSDRHLPLTLDLWKKLLTFSLSFIRWSWSSSCLSCMSLVEFLFALLLLLSVLNSCVWVSFPHLLGHILVARIFTTLPNSHSWCSPSSHSCYSSMFLLIFQAHILVVFSSRIFAILLDHILDVPSLRSCYSKLTFLLHFLVVFLLFFSIMFMLRSHSSVVLPSRVLLLQACVLAILE